MTRALVLLSALTLAACGSNVPPPDASHNKADHSAIPGMTMPSPTGNQDRDFARMMIVHHQGAIDMSRKQLARGTDPALRKMATEIIAAQQREIAELNAFLDRTGGR
jgi:uncharacterized protein (DUF305 family)